MNSAVIKEFVQAVSNSNNAYNLSINPTSVKILDSPVTDPTTAPTPRPVAPNTVAAAITTTTAAPITKALVIKRVIFSSLLTDFTSDLLNPSSTAYINRAAKIKEQLTPVFKREFPSFKFLEVKSFSNGSIVNNMDLSFSSTSVPNNDQIAQVLMSAAASIIGFDIEGSFLNLNGIYSSGVSHYISPITASFLVLLSWLLSSQWP
ncbi:uncharacterized protein LOC117487837 [Trematomus bernacchii]|uniref:uncharacterized protein LOC117487837 n=1 Tax=Trematomus bernacchii TaxID=40690 RepID=UPI00146CC8C7|nr:uncharacterized protein LOC117487837 [Trematomus bernacchii]